MDPKYHNELGQAKNQIYYHQKKKASDDFLLIDMQSTHVEREAKEVRDKWPFLFNKDIMKTLTSPSLACHKSNNVRKDFLATIEIKA